MGWHMRLELWSSCSFFSWFFKVYRPAVKNYDCMPARKKQVGTDKDFVGALVQRSEH